MQLLNSLFRVVDRRQEGEQTVFDVELCAEHLIYRAHFPGIQAQVFMMREHLGLSTQEISTQTQLTGNNINVMLYRARLKLQKCLQQNWLGDDAARSPRTRKTDGHAA